MKNDWGKKTLGDVCNFVGGSQPPKSEFIYDLKGLNNDDYVRLIQIRDYKSDNHIVYIPKSRTKKFCAKDDVMIGRYGPPVFQILKGLEGAYNVALMKAEPKSQELTKNFLFKFLQTPKVQSYIVGLSERAAGQSGVNKRALNDYPIPIPSISEQKRIVAILDGVFGGISQAVTNAEKNLANARELFESYLNSVFTKKGEGWVKKPFSDVCDFVRGPFGGSLKKSCFVDDGYAVYEQQHAINNQFDQIRYFVDESKFDKMSRFELRSGDLIMSCSGTMGRVAITPEGIKRGIINQALLKLSPIQDLVAEFLKYWMESGSFQEQIAMHSQGAAIKNVASVKVLKKIDVPLPNISAQDKIVSRLDDFSQQTQHLETIYQQKLTALSELKQSILQKAFAGELTADTIQQLVNG